MGRTMNERIRSQEISIRLELIEEAIARQLKSQAADEGLEKGKRGTVATPQQIVGSRRRADDIIIDLLSEWSNHKVRTQNTKNSTAQSKHQGQDTTVRRSRRKAHRGRRSQESLMKRASQ